MFSPITRDWVISKESLLGFLNALLLFVQTQSSCNLSSIDKSNLKLITKAAGKLGTDLMKLISKEGSDNIIISPLSILTPMQIILYGAEHPDSSYKEIENYLEYDILCRNPETIHDSMSKMLACTRQKTRLHSMISKAPTEMTMTNIFIAEEKIFEDLKPSFKSGAIKHYGMQLESFSQSDEGSISKMCNRINTLVSLQTSGAIEHVIDESEMSQQLGAMIMNVTYLKGSWLHEFESTRTSEFYNGGLDNGKKVPFMSLQNSFLYLNLTLKGSRHLKSQNKSSSKRQPDDEFSHCQVVSLPIDKHGLTMLILLPSKIDGLSKLYDVNIYDIMRRLKYSRQVRMRLPKFNFERKYHITDYMAQLGMGSLLNHPKLGRMFSQPVDLSEITHKAKINVTETGVEAAALTQMKLMKSNWRDVDDGKPIPFIADHSFMFATVHMNHPAPLFMGQVVIL